MRVIALPAVGKSVSLRVYIDAIRVAKANPDVEFRHGLTTWWPTSGRDIVAQFRAGLHDRINQAIPYRMRGRRAA